MATIETVPIAITPEAEARIEALGLRDALTAMLERCKSSLWDLHAIEVSLDDDPSLSDEPCILLHAHRSPPGDRHDDSDRAWRRWFLSSFPPDIVRRFCLVNWFGGSDGR